VKIVLNPPLGGKAVIIPSHGIKYIFTGHPLIPDNYIGMGVAENVADMEGSGNGRGRRIHGENIFPGRLRVIPVYPPALPLPVPVFFRFF
jgi:hypothetical protein